MGIFKFLTLAFVSTVTASTLFSTSILTIDQSTTFTTIYSTTIVKASASEPTQPAIVVTSFSAASDSGMMTVISSPTMIAPANNTIVIPLPITTTQVIPVNTTVAFTDVAVTPSFESSVISNLSTIVVTMTVSHATAASSASSSAGPKPSTVAVSSGGKVTVGIAVGLVALMVGVLGA
jgi:hypothetical protein